MWQLLKRCGKVMLCACLIAAMIVPLALEKANAEGSSEKVYFNGQWRYKIVRGGIEVSPREELSGDVTIPRALDEYLGRVPTTKSLSK